MSSQGRLTSLSPDNHQPWLWFTHIFSAILVLGIAGMRIGIKRRQYGKEDTVLLVSHGFYLAYWISLLIALLSSLGKSSRVSSEDDQIKASKLVFASRILLCIILCLVKVSNAFLILQIFTKALSGMKLWFYAALGSVAAQALVGILTISVGCSSTRLLEAGKDAFCANNIPRWIAFTTLENILEMFLLLPVFSGVAILQVGFKTKFFVSAAFVCRLIVCIPAWIHLALYIRFERDGKSNISLVPTIVAEELWTAVALASASIPVLMKVAQRFTTSGMVMGSNSLSTYRRRYADNAYEDDSTPATNIELTESNGVTIHQDSTDAYKFSVMSGKRGARSTNSSAESQVGILRELQFEVSSHKAVDSSSGTSPPK